MSGISPDSPSTVPPSAERRPFALALDRGCRYLLAAVFLLAALTKITDLRAFAGRLQLHSPLSSEVTQLAAHFLPWLELTCGACLLLGHAVREAALLVALLLLLFLIHGLFQPTASDCGCLLFPVAQPTAPWWQPARNLLLLLGSVRLVRRG